MLSLKADLVKKILLFITIIKFFSVSYYNDSVTQAELIGHAPNIIWKKEYGDTGIRHRYKAIALSDKEIFIATTSIEQRDQNYINTSWLWRINKNSEKVDKIEIKNPQKNNNSRMLNTTFSDIKSLLVNKNGDLLLVIDFIENHPWIVRIDKLRKELSFKDIYGPLRSISVSKIIPIDDHNYLLIGHELFDSLVMKINAEGEVLWERKKDDRGKIEFFVDGVSEEDGGFLLIENSGKYKSDTLFKPTSISVRKCNARGEVEYEKTFTGRYGNITKTIESGYAVVYDKSNSKNQSIWIRLFTTNLEEIRACHILDIPDAEFGLSNFKIATLPDGNFIVAGGKEFKPFVTKIDMKGNKIWEFWEKTQNISMDFDMILLKNEFIIISSIFARQEKNKFVQKFMLIRFID